MIPLNIAAILNMKFMFKCLEILLEMSFSLSNMMKMNAPTPTSSREKFGDRPSLHSW